MQSASMIVSRQMFKFAPLKFLTIPRLKLCGFLVLSRLVRLVLEALSLRIHKCFLWTDCTIVLNWINTDLGLLQVFVENRAAKIQ